MLFEQRLGLVAGRNAVNDVLRVRVGFRVDAGQGDDALDALLTHPVDDGFRDFRGVGLGNDLLGDEDDEFQLVVDVNPRGVDRHFVSVRPLRGRNQFHESVSVGFTYGYSRDCPSGKGNFFHAFPLPCFALRCLRSQGRSFRDVGR